MAKAEPALPTAVDKTLPGGLEIVRMDVYPLDVPLLDPFTIASSRVDFVRNVAIAIQLCNGCIGWGEAPTLPPVTVEDQPVALSAANEVAEWLVGRHAAEWRSLSTELTERLPLYGSVRAGIEMALFDALAQHARLPLYQYFGGRLRTLVTDITIPICSPDEAERLAALYRAQGFGTIKVKIGLDTDDDIARLLAIRRGHPGCALVMDANEGYTAEQALGILAELRRHGIEPALLEQPVAREDWEGLERLAREAKVPVAADESCRSPADALRIVRGSLAQVINIKLAKCGVVQALDIAAIARTAEIGLMIGGMVETRLAMGFSAHFAAGLGGFDWIDLDTPLLLADDPIVGGPRIDAATYRLDPERPGHGGALSWGAR